VCEFVRAREGPAVVGDYAEGVGENGDDCGCAYRTEAERARGDRSVARTNEAITAENRSFLRGLRDGIDLELGDLAVALVHGSPRRVNGYLHEDRPDASLERLLDLAEADVLVRGHTRRGGPTSRRSRRRLDGLEDRVVRRFGRRVRGDPAIPDRPVPVEDEHGAVRHAVRAEVGQVDRRVVRQDDVAARVAHEVELDAVFVAELAPRERRVRAHAEHGRAGVAEAVEVVPVRPSRSCTAA
jgi:hypothetical protein